MSESKPFVMFGSVTSFVKCMIIQYCLHLIMLVWEAMSHHFNKSKGILIIRVYCVGRYLYIKAYYSTKTFRIRSFKCLHKEFVIKGRQESLSSTTYKEYVIEPAKRAAEQILMWNHGLPRKKSKVDLSQLWWNKD